GGEHQHRDGCNGGQADGGARQPELPRLAGVDDHRRDRPRTDQQRHAERHDQAREASPRPAAGVCLALGRGGESGCEILARHLQAKQEQDHSAGDAEGRQGDAEEGQQRQAGEVEEGEEAQHQQRDIEGHQPAPARVGARRRGGEQRHVADRVDQGEQGDEEVDREVPLAHAERLAQIATRADMRAFATETSAMAAPALAVAPQTADPRLIVALDVPTVEEAAALVARLDGAVSFYKVGLELFAGDGMALARELKAQGKQVFLDWKLHDIGATVERAAAALVTAGCDLLTVRGETQVMEAALRGKGGSDLKILAVTVLTSLTDADLVEIGYAEGAAALVERRIHQAI